MAHRPTVAQQTRKQEITDADYFYSFFKQATSIDNLPSRLGTPQPRQRQQPAPAARRPLPAASARCLQHCSLAMGGLSRPDWADSMGAFWAVAGDSVDDGRER